MTKFYLAVSLFLTMLAHAQSGYSKKEIEALTLKADKNLSELRFKESLELAREALKRAIYIKDDYQIALAYNAIAGNFDELSENDKAIANYKKALAHATRAKNDSLVGWLNNNLGNMYFFEKKEYDAGIGYYEKALEFAAKTKDTSELVFTNLNLTLAYFDTNRFDKGRSHLDFINRYHDKFGDLTTVVYLHMLNGMYDGYRGNFSRGEARFARAINIAKREKQTLDLCYTYEEYSKFLKQKGNYKDAYRYLNYYTKMKDSIYDSERLHAAGVEGVNFEIDEYRRAIREIETEKEIQGLKLQRQKVVVVLFVIGVGILLVLLYTLYKANVFRKRMNVELTETNAELQQAKERAEEASRLKSQFVSTISHELRTPLYGVVGITNMILDEHKELAGSTHLNSLKFSAKYLLSLVNDILQINKIEENRLTLENLTFNVSDEINTIKNSLQFIANKNNNEITIEIDTDIPEFVIGDKLRLSQIFMNLVSNALKFTKNGEVIISATLDRVQGKMHFIRFSVRDNGIGIAKSDQDKIFEKFVQIERKSEDYQGTGLGLSIVKKLIAVFDSEIHMESSENKGTTFTFTIGFEVDPKKTAEIINNIEVDISSGQILNILVVEDNKINQTVTRKIIENNHYRCEVVDDGFAAIDRLKMGNTFDAILMDINMPGIDGFQTTREIRHMGIETPVIALTAFGKDEITEEAISSGMNDIIIKPFEPVRLFAIINRLVAMKKLV
jgi:signal transduction histidine kinase/Tfp pilus assembly protein PilF/ActR/RegA family two-component response regulator